MDESQNLFMEYNNTDLHKVLNCVSCGVAKEDVFQPQEKAILLVQST